MSAAPALCFSVFHQKIVDHRKGKIMRRNREKKLFSKVGFSLLATLSMLLLLTVGSKQAAGQACPAQNWAAVDTQHLGQ